MEIVLNMSLISVAVIVNAAHHTQYFPLLLLCLSFASLPTSKGKHKQTAPLLQ
jgi:hypothetical protein